MEENTCRGLLKAREEEKSICERINAELKDIHVTVNTIYRRRGGRSELALKI
jgi:hypothetical protein